MNTHEFLGFFGQCEIEMAAQRMWEIKQETRRVEFSAADFDEGYMRYGFRVWCDNPKYLVPSGSDGFYFATPSFWNLVREKITRIKPSYFKTSLPRPR